MVQVKAEVDETRKSRRGSQKQPRLDAKQKEAATKKAIAVRNAAELAEISKSNLALPAHIRITPEQYQMVLTRVIGGETVRKICADLDLPHGAVYARSAYDTEFAEEFFRALEIGQHALVDYMTEVAMDQSIGVERARLVVDVIKWQAARRSRAFYGDKVAIDARIQQIPIMLPRDIIDGEGGI